MQQLRHFKVKRRHNLLLCLTQINGHAAGAQIFRHLNSDKAAADDDGRFSPFINDFSDGIGVRNGPQCMDTRQINPRDGRANGGGAGSEYEFVVGLLIGLISMGNGDDLFLRINFCGFALNADIDIELALHPFHSLNQKGIAVLNDISNVIGEPAVGVADIASSLEHHNFHLLVQTAKTGGCSGAACDASDDDSFHENPSLFASTIPKSTENFCDFVTIVTKNTPQNYLRRIL